MRHTSITLFPRTEVSIKRLKWMFLFVSCFGLLFFSPSSAQPDSIKQKCVLYWDDESDDFLCLLSVNTNSHRKLVLTWVLKNLSQKPRRLVKYKIPKEGRFNPDPWLVCKNGITFSSECSIMCPNFDEEVDLIILKPGEQIFRKVALSKCFRLDSGDRIQIQYSTSLGIDEDDFANVDSNVVSLIIP